MAGKRARAPKKRADYRKGGRVHADRGLLADNATSPDSGSNWAAWRAKYEAPVYDKGSPYTGSIVPGTNGAPVYDKGMPKDYNPWDDINSGGGINTTSNDPTADANRTTGSVYNAAGADLGRVAMFDNNVKPVGVQETFNPAAVEAGDTSTTTTPAYTQADIDQAVADLNSGKITAAQLAAQYGVSEDYVNQNLKTINTQAAAAATTQTEVDQANAGGTKILTNPATGETMEVLVNDPRFTGLSESEQVALAFGAGTIKPPDDGFVGGPGIGIPGTPPATTTTAADVADIPVDGSYTEFETEQVVEAINSGAMTVKEVADTFGATEAQVQAELDRQNQKAAGEEVTGTDPFSTGVYNATKEKLQTKKVAKQQQAIKDSVKDVTFKGKPFNMGIPNLTSQILALDDQLKARGLKEGTPEYIAAQEQARAELVRFSQGTNQVNFSAEDFAAAIGRPVAEVLAGYYNYDFTGKDDLGLAYGEQITEAMQDANVPGSFLKSYQPIDTQAFVDKREAVKIDRTGTVTAEADIQKLDDYENIDPPDGITPNVFSAALTNLKQAAELGEVTADNYNAYLINEINNNPQWAENLNRPPVTVEEIRKLTERVKTAEFGTIRPQAMAQVTTKDFISDAASVGKVDFRKAVNISPTKEAEAASREAITGNSQNSDAAKITDEIGYEAYKRGDVTGQAASDSAVDFLAFTGEIDSNLARTMIEGDVVEVNAQLDLVEPEVVAAVAALPEEAYVSAQMQTLMAGMETGDIPVWAKPAFDAVTQNMTQRGIDASTVGRDALFNSIIQSALPIAQSNAQAVQANWSQRLSNEQQAELARAQLNSTRRMNNLANRQTSESQTAQFAQNIKVLQGQFDFDRDQLSFQQQQQVRVNNYQNVQRTLELNKEAENAFKAQSLGNEQQIELAELEIRNQTEQQNMTAINQERLAEMQMAADFLSKNAAFDQQMKLANLSNDQQMELANLTARNQADSESLSADQQTRLANLNTRMQTNITQGRIAENMGVALLSADQQRAVENAAMTARMDLTKFSAEQQIELANSKFMQTVELTDFNARQQSAIQNATSLASLDMAAVDQRTKLEITQAQNFLQRDMANLSNEQQALILDTQVEQQRLLSSQAAENAARQFGATSDNQMTQFTENLGAQINQFNAQQQNAMEQFNASEKNRISAINEANSIDAAKFNNQLTVQVDQFNEQMDLQRDQWNAANAQAIEQSNVQWRRQANTADTAATNAANQENAAKSFQISTADQNFVWQALRDDAAYLKQAYENEEQRKTTLYATALSNEIETGATGIQPIVDIVNSIIT